ncbi:TIGR01841 family phasin [Brackiella oedipodis]|uniref:TIGR01841 family phasin n=1 Tax=Brackiella oedipodis TaxID=124225 RepID=UPI00048E27C9|nr:TIGR01841 family phasin [Brackiella oedipodis]
MAVIPDQLAKQHQDNVNTYLTAQKSLFDGFEKLVNLNLQTMKAALQEQENLFKKVGEFKEPKEAIALAASSSQPNAEKAVNYSRSVYDIFANVSNELAQLAEKQSQQTRQQLNEFVDQLAKNAPTGSEGAVAILKSSIATANNAFDSINQSAKQATEAASSHWQNATNASLKATEQVSQAATAAATSATNAANASANKA